MSFARTFSAQTLLLKAKIIHVEVDLGRGLHAFNIVGLPDKGVEESKDRVSAAIKNSGFDSPKSKNQKVVVSLAPADIKKEGPSFDLAIALAYLLASEELDFDPDGKLFLGELSLQGELRPIRGILPLVKEAKEKGFSEIYVPSENAEEAALISGIAVFPVKTLMEIIDHLSLKHGKPQISPQPKTEIDYTKKEMPVSFDDVRGQESAKRGLEIAAAGGHNIAMWGPPGTGKTMLARAFTGILPPLSFDEILEVTSIHSVAGALRETLVTEAPFRTPHHTSSYVSLVGGGTFPKPGEITLAHRGVLFLDEFPEFDKRVIESLRQPLEDRIISIARAKGSAQFPAQFILVAAMNPCPCGHYGSKQKQCICMPMTLERYKRKLSGPIIDRIDMWLEVTPVEHTQLSGSHDPVTKGERMRDRVAKAREIQKERFEKAGRNISLNSEMNARDIANLITLSEEVKDVLDLSALRMQISGRSYHRIMKLARTIADLEGSSDILRDHILEAIQYRPKT